MPPGPTLADVLAQLHGVRREGRAWVALCPVHPDRHPSLRIAQGHSQVLVVCRSCGAHWPEIRTALALDPTPAEAAEPDWRVEMWRMARRAPWWAPDLRIVYAAAACHRILLGMIAGIETTVRRLPPELPWTWDLLEHQQTLESLRRDLEVALDRWSGFIAWGDDTCDSS